MKKTFFIALALIGVGFLAKPNEVSASTITIQKGDTLWEYSQKYNIPVDTIAKFNNINLNNYVMWPGDKINIPDGKDNESGAQFTNRFVAATPAVSTYTKPATQVTTQSVQQSAPVQTEPTATTTTNATVPLSSSEASAKAAIAYRESRGSYTAQNGKYYGKYQLDLSYLNGDLSQANQEATAGKYVASRYGTWTNALAHSNATGWY